MVASAALAPLFAAPDAEAAFLAYPASAAVASAAPFADVLQSQQALMRAQREAYESTQGLQSQWALSVRQMILPDGHPQIAALQAQIAQLAQQRDSASAQIVRLTQQRDAAEARLISREATIAELQRSQADAESRVEIKREIAQQARHEKRKAEEEREEAEEKRNEEAKRRRVAEEAAEAKQQGLAAAAQRAESLEAEKAALENQVPICCMCLDARPAVRFGPCQHVAVCATCNGDLIAAKDKLCPKCRAEVKKREPVML